MSKQSDDLFFRDHHDKLIDEKIEQLEAENAKMRSALEEIHEEDKENCKYCDAGNSWLSSIGSIAHRGLHGEGKEKKR